MVENNENAAERPRPVRPASAPKPAGAPQKPVARPAAAGAPKPAARPAGAAPAGAGAAKRPVAKPAAAPRARGEGDDGGEERHERMHVKQETLDAPTKYGLIGAGGLAVIVAIVLVVVSNKKTAEREARERYEAKVEDVYKKLSTLDVSSEGDAVTAIELAESTRKDWQDHDKARDIEVLLVKAKAKIEIGKSQRETLTRFGDVEKKLADVSNITPEGVKDLRRQLEELEVKVQVLGPELVARYGAARSTADRAYATRLLDDATKFAAENAGENARLALQRFQTAEDGLKELVDRAYMDKNKELQDFYTPLYKQAIQESDRLVTELFSGAKADQLPVIDCLAGEKATQWNASQAKGFSWRIDNGVLQIVGPDADANKSAVISIGDREQWRSLIADLEFTVEKEAIDMYFRLGKAPNANTPMYTLRATGNNAQLTPGKSYRAKASLIGSEFRFTYADDQADPPESHVGELSWVFSRRGAIGLLVPPGARLKFTKFKVRELR